jgi:hypothetical protein
MASAVILNVVAPTKKLFSTFFQINVIYGERSAFPAWARNTVTINHLLVVMNSSLNFVIYCKVFYSSVINYSGCGRHDTQHNDI